MMSRRHKWIFIHVPRTGGDWVEACLSRGSEDRIFMDCNVIGLEATEIRAPGMWPENSGYTKHMSWYRYRDYLGSEEFNKYTVFSAVRNAWDRARSTFQYLVHPDIGNLVDRDTKFRGMFEQKAINPLGVFLRPDCFTPIMHHDLSQGLVRLADEKGWPYVVATKRNSLPPVKGFWSQANIDVVTEYLADEIKEYDMKPPEVDA